jgi:hypothetical protein
MMRLLVMVAALAIPALGAAQDVPLRPPRVEVGGQIGVLGTISGDGFFPLLSMGPRLSVTLTDRLGVDVLAENLESAETEGLFGLYQIQIRHIVRPGRTDRAAIFLTGGVMGLFREWDLPEYRYSLPDGTIVVYPGRDGIEVNRPIGVVGGVGVQRAFRRYAAVRADTQLMVGFHGGWLVRGSVGLSVPFGGYTRR